jgi:GntR family transcriptional regulator, transcriptional repressor for pyruvate dehydrogenase complex
MFKPLDRKKVSLDIFDRIMTDILNKKFKPGDALPQEKKMAEQFGVSRQILREALRALEAIGMLEIKKGGGGGPVISEIDREDLRKFLVNFFIFKDIPVQELFQVRKLIEPYLAAEAAKNMKPEQVAELEKINRDCRRIVERGRSILGNPKEIQFHMKIAGASGNLLLEALLDFVTFFIANFKKYQSIDLGYSERVLDLHEQVTDAIKNHDDTRAGELIFAHICDVEANMDRR